MKSPGIFEDDIDRMHTYEIITRKIRLFLNNNIYAQCKQGVQPSKHVNFWLFDVFTVHVACNIWIFTHQIYITTPDILFVHPGLEGYLLPYTGPGSSHKGHITGYIVNRTLVIGVGGMQEDLLVDMLINCLKPYVNWKSTVFEGRHFQS